MATQKIQKHTHTQKSKHKHTHKTLNKQKVTHNNKIVSVMEKRNLHISVYLSTIDCVVRVVLLSANLGSDSVEFKQTLVNGYLKAVLLKD